MEAHLDDTPARIALQELRLRGELVEQLADAVLAVDERGLIVECNPVARQLFGLAPGMDHRADFRTRFEIWCEGFTAALGDDEGPLHTALRGEEHPSALFHLIERAGGRSLWIRERALALRDQRGQIVGALSVSSDLSAARGSRQLLSDRDAQFGALLRALPDHLLKLDAAGTILSFKPAHGSEGAIRPSQYLGRTLAELLPPALLAASMPPLHQALAAQRPAQFELEHEHDQRKLVFEVRLSPIDARELIAVVRDISERRQREREREAAREELATLTHLAHVSEMAAAMSHELNQPLSAIGLYARGSLRRLESDPEDLDGLRRALGSVVEQSQRAAEIIRRFRNFARSGVGGFELHDIHPLIQRVAHIARYEAQERGVEIRLQTGAGPTFLLLDRAQIQQAILQLVRNAIEACVQSESGRRIVEISTSDSADASALELHVRDLGCGIPEADRERIFDLFYTTKRNGVGLGLPIARSIAVAHGGRLFVESSSQDGTAICLRLPIAKEGEAHA